MLVIQQREILIFFLVIMMMFIGNKPPLFIGEKLILDLFAVKFQFSFWTPEKILYELYAVELKIKISTIHC